MNTEIVEEIIFKLVGKIQPIGESTTDGMRFENLIMMCDLVNRLVTKIDEVAYDNKDRHEYSMKRAGEYAKDFLTKTLGINE
jgi:hypothetical protein